MAKIKPCRFGGKRAGLPLFYWADERERRTSVTYPARWLCRRFPELNPCMAELISWHAGLGARDD